MLYQGKAPYRIPTFFKELFKEIPNQLESKQIKEILDSLTAIYNEKLKKEKEEEKTKKKP